tara:strand:+ start:294 stop:509 length:216 start_codon:yes stop_codon:yes gene_type:complete
VAVEVEVMFLQQIQILVELQDMVAVSQVVQVVKQVLKHQRMVLPVAVVTKNKVVLVVHQLTLHQTQIQEVS